jgi:hypothetical protein
LRVFAAPEWCSCSCSSTTRTHNVLSLVASRLLQQQHVQHVSSSAAAALAAAQAAPSLAEPCVLSARVPRPAPRSAASGSNVVHYPYSLPALYAPRRCQLQDLQGQPLGAVELPGDVFNVPVRVDILHQVVRWQRAKARQGTHKTKDRSEVCSCVCVCICLVEGLCRRAWGCACVVDACRLCCCCCCCACGCCTAVVSRLPPSNRHTCACRCLAAGASPGSRRARGVRGRARYARRSGGAAVSCTAPCRVRTRLTSPARCVCVCVCACVCVCVCALVGVAAADPARLLSVLASAPPPACMHVPHCSLAALPSAW